MVEILWPSLVTRRGKEETSIDLQDLKKLVNFIQINDNSIKVPPYKHG
jgi:hypothetical protein